MKIILDEKLYDKLICANSLCRNMFLRRKQSSKCHSALPNGVRGKNCLTCCTKCSKLYADEYRFKLREQKKDETSP